MGAVRRIYRHFDLPLTDLAAQRMGRLVSKRSRYPGRLANRTLADLGFDVHEEVMRFNRYCFRFGIPCRPSGLS
jgi:hypothetical protein